MNDLDWIDELKEKKTPMIRKITWLIVIIFFVLFALYIWYFNVTRVERKLTIPEYKPFFNSNY